MINLKDQIAKNITTVHRVVFQKSNGKLLGSIMSMPVVALTTTGRKTGKKRTTMLTSPVQPGDNVILVASKGGDTRHPVWYLNLSSNPDVSIEMAGKKRQMTARTASKEEKADLWPQIVRAYKGYAGYQEKTDRDIPVVISEPR